MYSTVHDLNSHWSTTNDKRFVKKAVWVTINGDAGGQWIENGYREGAKMNLPYCFETDTTTGDPLSKWCK